mgnify:CR=1 FL=1
MLVPVIPPYPKFLFKLLTSVQLVPSQISVSAASGEPPQAKAAVAVPQPCLAYFAVFRSATSVHDEPSQDSVAPVTGGAFPPKPKADVFEAPAPPRISLAVLRSATSVQEELSHDSVIVT